MVLFLLAGLTKADAQLTQAHKIMAGGEEIIIQPVMHSSLVLNFKGKNIYIDPSGGADLFKGMAAPDVIIITDIHGDHFDPKTIEAINTNNAIIVAPQVVADKLTISKQKVVVINNGSERQLTGMTITALPMYNLPESADSRNTKGRGNGYVINMGGKNIYISGDTEAIAEMRSLKNIDVAFVCMNLPYTMDVKQAAQGVLDFKPVIVYPYHYRGQDINTFKTLVNAGGKNIEVRLRNWYPIMK